jgi:transcriptional regulator with XRE-family HTH domain
MEKVELGQRVKSLRQRASISGRELANLVGVSPGFISQLERGKTSASLATLRGIADAFGQPIAALLTGGGRSHIALNGAASRDGVVAPAAQVVRKGRRKRLELPGSHFSLELLSPDLQGQIEFILIELAPGHPPTEPRSHIRGARNASSYSTAPWVSRLGTKPGF